jgi:hypothetical protein
MQEAIIPVLKRLASQLKHLTYYVLQTREGDWLVTTLLHREEARPEKKVVYGFATRQDAARAGKTSSLPVKSVPIPATHLLFQLFALEGVDSLILLEIPGNLEQGKEIGRSPLQEIIQQQLKQLSPSRLPQPKAIPPNLA